MAEKLSSCRACRSTQNIVRGRLPDQREHYKFPGNYSAMRGMAITASAFSGIFQKTQLRASTLLLWGRMMRASGIFGAIFEQSFGGLQILRDYPGVPVGAVAIRDGLLPCAAIGAAVRGLREPRSLRSPGGRDLLDFFPRPMICTAGPFEDFP
jgi:hypothetical protein